MKTPAIELGSPIQAQRVVWEDGSQRTVWVPGTVIHVAPDSLQARLEDGKLVAFMKTSPRWRPATA